MKLVDHPEAEAELIAVAKFYEARSPGLGDRFLREFQDTISAMQAAPDRWVLVEKDPRCSTMRRFPFGIYFRVDEDELRILVVKHHSRHPDYWRHRLAE